MFASVTRAAARSVSFELAMVRPLLFCNRRIAWVRQICFQDTQGLQQALPVGLGRAGQRLAACDFAELTELRQFRLGSLGEMKQPDPAVRRMRTAFDQALCLQLVDDAAERDRLDIEE